MRQFIPAPVVKDIADQAITILYGSASGHTNPKESIMALWAKHKAKLSDSTEEGLLKEFEHDIFVSLGPQTSVSKGASLTKALSKYQNQADNGLMGLWVDFFDFLNNLESDPSKADMKWLRLLARPEKFCQYFETDNRYVMHGFRNQALISKAIADRSVDHLKPIVILKEDFEKLLDFDFDGDPGNEKNYQFEKSQFVMNKIRSLKSLTSIIAPQQHIAYVTAKNTEWKGGEPTPEQINKYQLEKREVVHFKSKPVWLVDDMKWMLSPNQSLKLKELVAKRLQEEPDPFGGLDNSTGAVQHFMDTTSKLTSLRLCQGNVEGYRPLEDSGIINPDRIKQNPWIALANYGELLSRSCCHLTERDYQKKETQEGHLDSFLNFVITHNAISQLHHHLQDINMGYLTPEDEQWIEQYHNEFVSNKKDLIAKVRDQFVSKETVNHKGMEGFLKRVAENQLIIQTGMVKDKPITSEMRQEALKANVQRRNHDQDKHRESSLDV